MKQSLRGGVLYRPLFSLILKTLCASVVKELFRVADLACLTDGLRAAFYIELAI